MGKARTRGRAGVGVAGLVLAGLVATGTAVAAPTDDAPASSTSTWAPTMIETIPAFDDDLPKGSVEFGSDSAPQTIPGGPAQSSGGSTVTSTTEQGAAATASWVCTVYASDPSISASKVYGSGWQSCSGTGFLQTALKVTIQTYTGLGLWKN
jgi:hypothetical protein